MTTTQKNPLARALGAPGAVGFRRDDSGSIVLMTPDWLTAQARASRRRPAHSGIRADVSPGEPCHLLIRDAVSSKVDGFLAKLDHEIPRCHEILEDYRKGRILGFENLQRADAEYVRELGRWAQAYSADRRNDADTVWLHMETVFVMSRVLEVTYLLPTIGNAIPRDVLGTALETWTQFIEEETDEIAQVGDSWSPYQAPTVALSRNEVARKLKFFKASVDWTDRELEIAQEVRRNAPDTAPSWDIVRKKSDAAARMMARTAGMIEAFGLHYDDFGIPGLLWGADEIHGPSVAEGGIEVEEVEFADLADPTGSIDALSALVRQQQAAVSYRDDKVADSLMIDPASALALAQTVYNSANSSNITAWDMFMERNPSIRNVYVTRELRHDPDSVTHLQDKLGGDQVKAERMAGGMRFEDEQRSALVLFRRDPSLLALVTGRQLESKTFPPHYDKHSTVLRQSSGGAVAYEPRTALIAVRPTAGDPVTPP